MNRTTNATDHTVYSNCNFFVGQLEPSNPTCLSFFTINNFYESVTTNKIIQTSGAYFRTSNKNIYFKILTCYFIPRILIKIKIKTRNFNYELRIYFILKLVIFKIKRVHSSTNNYKSTILLNVAGFITFCCYSSTV